MTLLFASVCLTLATVVRAICWYLGGVLCHDGWRRRAYRAATSSLPRGHVNLVDHDRIAIRCAARKRLTAVGESFSEWLQPSHKPRQTGGIPSATNPYVDFVALICVLVGIVLSGVAAVAAVRAVVSADVTAVVIEATVGMGAIAGGLAGARIASFVIGQRKSHTGGLLAILCTGLLGALGGAFLTRSLLCTLRIPNPYAGE